MVYLIPRVIYISNQEVVFVLFNLKTETQAFPEPSSKMATLPSPPPRSSYDSSASSARTTKGTLAERLRNYINSLPSPSTTTLTEKKTQLTSSSTQTIGYCHELTPLFDAQKQGTSRRTEVVEQRDCFYNTTTKTYLTSQQTQTEARFKKAPTTDKKK